MIKKTLVKKLSLKKETVTNLTVSQLNDVKGGCTWSCYWEFCAPSEFPERTCDLKCTADLIEKR